MFDVSIGRLISTIFLSGIIATTGITLFLFVFSRKFANVDIVRVLGSYITKSDENAFRVGIILHYVWGILFALVYTLILGFIDPPKNLNILLISSLTGVFHGIVASFMMIIFVAEHHPLEKYRRKGLASAAIYLIAHIIYGLLVGVTITGMVYPG